MWGVSPWAIKHVQENARSHLLAGAGEGNFTSGLVIGSSPDDEEYEEGVVSAPGAVAGSSGELTLAGIFRDLADAEDGLNPKAQGILAGMGRGPAAELLGRVVDRGNVIRDPSRYVVASANKAAKEKEAAAGA